MCYYSTVNKHMESWESVIPISHTALCKREEERKSIVLSIRQTLIGIVAVMGITFGASANQIIYTNVFDGLGNYEIYVEVTGANDGLESFSMDIVPNNLLTIVDESPFIQANTSFQPVGFSEPLAVVTPVLLFNSQQTLTALPLVGGFGNSTSDFVTQGQTSFGAPLDRAQAWGGGVSGALASSVGPNAMLIASGTYTPQAGVGGNDPATGTPLNGAPMIDATGANNAAGLVYSDVANRQLVSPDEYIFLNIPEPASLALIGLAGITVLRRRK